MEGVDSKGRGVEKWDKVGIEEQQHLEASEEKQARKDQDKTEPREVMTQEFQEAESNQKSMLGR